MNEYDEMISEYAYRANRLLDHPVLSGCALLVGICSLGYMAYKGMSEIVDDIKLKREIKAQK